MRIDVTSFLALLASILALVVSLVQAHEAYQINRLQIRPHLKVQVIDTPLSENEEPGVFLVNSGNGSAIIHTFQLHGKPPQDMLVGEVFGGAAFRPDEKYPILYQHREAKPTEWIMLRQRMNSVKASVCYCDLGGFKCWQLTTTLPLSATSTARKPINSCPGSKIENESLSITSFFGLPK
jgi:hypothetical protein